ATCADAAFDPSRASAYLKAHFRVAALDGFGFTPAAAAAVGPAGAALRYLKDTQKTDAAHVDRLFVAPKSEHLFIDDASRANLEILKTLQDGGRKGSLLGVLDRNATAM